MKATRLCRFVPFGVALGDSTKVPLGRVALGTLNRLALGRQLFPAASNRIAVSRWMIVGALSAFIRQTDRTGVKLTDDRRITKGKSRRKKGRGPLSFPRRRSCVHPLSTARFSKAPLYCAPHSATGFTFANLHTPRMHSRIDSIGLNEISDAQWGMKENRFYFYGIIPILFKCVY